MTFDYEDVQKVSQISGSISGFTNITPDKLEPDKTLGVEYDYHLGDLYLALKTLSNNLHSTNVSSLIDAISKHIADVENPHQTTLSSMGTDVMQELYKAWMADGHVGTEEVFVKVLFQYLEIADVLTTLEGIEKSKVVSVYGAKELIRHHDEDLGTHQVIFDKIFPGTKFVAPCTFSVHRTVGVPASTKVERNGTMQIIGHDGNMKTLAKDTLEVDYTYKEGYIPIFGYHTNMLLNTDAMLPRWAPITIDSSGKKCSVVNSTVQPLKTGTTPKRIVATTELNTVQGLEYTTGTSVTEGKTYTFSVFVRPEEATCFGISVNNSILNTYPFVHFNFETGEVYVHETNTPNEINGGIATLNNGWYRVYMSFRATSSGICKPTMYLLDIHNGDRFYSPSRSNEGSTVFGPQLNLGGSMAPYITSGNTAGVLQPTFAYIPFETGDDTWFNPDKGTFVFHLKNIPTVSNNNDTSPSISDASKNISTLGTLSNPNVVFTLNFISGVRMIQIHNRANNNGVVLEKAILNVDRENLTIVWSYTNKEQFIGRATVAEPEIWSTNSSLKTSFNCLTLGSDVFKKNMLEGYIEAIYYYPDNCDVDNAEFFIAETQY